MALPQATVFRQDLPPPGGFSKPAGFPAEGYRKRSPARGPTGAVIVAAALGATLFGWWRLMGDIEERNYKALCRFNERFERAYVMQAQEDAQWQRRNKRMLDGERELMKNVPGWVVGAPRYYTQPERRPDMDVLDARKIGPW